MKKRISTFIKALAAFAAMLTIGSLEPIAAASTQSNINKALAKCREFSTLSSSQLTRLAQKNHTTVAFIHNGCYALAHRKELAKDPNYALAACGEYDQMSDRQLTKIARQGGSTVAHIRRACAILEDTQVSNEGEPSNSGSESSSSTPQDPRPICQCGPFEVCVADFSRWTCVDKRASDNRCQSNFDCHGTFSSCVDNKCT